MDFWRLQTLNGRLVQAPARGFWAVGDGTTPDPAIPNLPFEDRTPSALATPKPEIDVRSTSSVSYSSRTNTTYTAPAGIVDGDIIVIYHGLFGTPPAPTPPSGFTLYDDGAGPLNVVDGGYSGDLYLYWKRASGESGNYTVTHSASNSAGLIVAYKNCLASGTPFGAQSADNSGTNNLGIGNSLVATADRSRLIFMEMDVVGGGGLTPPDGMVERIDTEVYIADQRLAREGETSATRRHTNGGTAWATRMVELLAAVGTVTSTVTAAITEADDTLASSATLSIIATGALTEADDTLNSAVALSIISTGAITEADDTLNSAVALSIIVTSAFTEDDDTLSSSSVVTDAGSLVDTAITEADDTLAANVRLDIISTAAIGEADDTLAATAALSIFATGALLEADDTLTSDTFLTIFATGAITEEDDSITSPIALSIIASGALGEADDTLSSAVQTFIPGPEPSNTPWHTKRRRRNTGPYRLGAPAL